MDTDQTPRVAAEPTPDTSLRCDGCGEPCASSAPDFMFRRDYWEPWRLTKGHINCVDSVWRPEDFEDAAEMSGEGEA